MEVRIDGSLYTKDASYIICKFKGHDIYYGDIIWDCSEVSYCNIALSHIEFDMISGAYFVGQDNRRIRVCDAGIRGR